MTVWRKSIRRIWKIDRKTHNNLLHHINNCLHIEILVERRCIKFIRVIINSEHLLHSRIALYSLYKDVVYRLYRPLYNVN